MGLFSRKPLISIEDFCQDFYDHFFNFKVKGIDMSGDFFDVAFDTVAKTDPSFATVNRVLFRREMTAIRMELFGLAWMHYFKAKHEQLEYCLRETSFTKKYLESTGRTEIWDIMQFYNGCIGESAFEAFTEERIRRAQIVFVNNRRMHLYRGFAGKNRFHPKMYVSCFEPLSHRRRLGEKSHTQSSGNSMRKTPGMGWKFRLRSFT